MAYSLFYTYVDPDTEPILRDLSNEVVPKVVAKVKPLALELGLEDHDVAAIQLSHPFDPLEQALAVFIKWRDLDKNYTWGFLIKALKAKGVGLDNLANDLLRLLRG